jgi:hypothetical protein
MFCVGDGVGDGGVVVVCMCVQGMAEVLLWFKDNVENPMRKNGIKVTLRLVKVNNTVKKPGPVFLEMARAAYNAGAEYFYRINDDTELMVNWPNIFISGMKRLSVPYGVIGPLCNQGNERILTHDFTTRLHMDIFEMNYYPPELTDWWMDDWISLVYGKARTFKARAVPVMHHTGSHGTRYAVDASNAGRLGSLVEAGRKKIRQWMLTHNVPEGELRAFDADEYKAFSHTDIPPAALGRTVHSSL